jgi:hypothetical protein
VIERNGKQYLTGSGIYGFEAEIDGVDLVVRNVRATFFGGNDDPEDNGLTASGVPTRDNPSLLGCSLPMKEFRATAGSPIPRQRWGAQVRVYARESGKQVVTQLVDVGPSPPPRTEKNTGIDLTEAAFDELGGDRYVGFIMVDYRIFDGARQWLAQQKSSVSSPSGS